MFVIVTCPYAWGLKDSFKDEICTIEDVLQLNWNWFSIDLIFNWNWNLWKVAILAPKVFSTSLYAWRIISSFEDEIRTIGYVPQINWNWWAHNRMWYFLMVLNICRNKTFLAQIICSSSLFVCSWNHRQCGR